MNDGKKACNVYAKIFGEDVSDTGAGPAIVKEMRAIADAPTEEIAMDVIRWWGCWEDAVEEKVDAYRKKLAEDALRRAVRRVRKEMAR